MVSFPHAAVLSGTRPPLSFISSQIGEAEVFMDLYIVRHGNPNYMTDSLTELGHRQAKAAAQELVKLGIDEIYSSPMGRAKETAQYLCELCGLEMKIEPWAHETEHYGDNGHGGITHAVQMDPTFLRSPEVEAMGDRWVTHPAFRGEKEITEMVKTVEDGARDFLARLGYELEGNRFRITEANDKNVVLFCHAGMFLVLTAFLLRMPQLTAWHSFFMYQTGITRCNFYNYDSGYTVGRYLWINDTHHLKKEGIELT